jgi:hypothetical protein
MTNTTRRYRITFAFTAFPTTRQFVVEGNEKLHLYGTAKEQVNQAVQQAMVLCAVEYMGANVGERIVKVEREWESSKGWDEIVTAHRAVPGTQIRVWSTSSNQDGFGVRSTYFQITVGRWEGTGEGDARLIDTRGQHMGCYQRDDVFEVVA